MLDTPQQSLSLCRGPLLETEWALVARRLHLSPRQVEIVHDVMLDEKEQTIADRLGISNHTVHTHLKRIYIRLGVASRVELVTRLLGEYAMLARQGRFVTEQSTHLKVRRAA